MLKETLKRTVLTGATVMVLLSTAAPAAMASAQNPPKNPVPDGVPYCDVYPTSPVCAPSPPAVAPYSPAIVLY